MSPQEFWLLFNALVRKSDNRGDTLPGGTMSRARFTELVALLHNGSSA